MEKRKGLKLGKRRISLIACIGLVLIVTASLLPSHAFAQQKASQPKTLKIGYLLALSGWYSVFDVTEERYLKAAAQMINERGGVTVQGQKYNIELVGQDGKSTLDGFTAGATKLVYDEKVKFVIGPSGFFGPGSGPVFEPNKVLHISGYATTQPGDVDPSTPYGFLSYNSSVGLSITAMGIFKKDYPKVKRIAVSIPDDGAIPSLIPKVKKIMESHGFTMAGEHVPFANTIQDLSPIVAKINAIKDSDGLLIVNGAPSHFGQIAKGLRALGNKKPIVCVTTTDVKDILAVSGKEGGDDVVGQAPTPGAKGNPPALDELFEKAGKKMPIYLLSANGLWVLARVIEAANSIDPTVVKAKWETMDGVDCFFGSKCTFGGDETYRLKHHVVGHPQPYQKLVKGQAVNGGWMDPGIIP